jgi:VanZ family protein
MSDWSTTRTARWMLGFILLLMLYGSLQPFQLRHVAFDSPLELLLKLRWGRSPPGDMFVNVLLYMPFGAALAWVLPARWPVAGRLALATLAGAAISLCVEMSQWFIVSRVASLADVTTNTTGAALGCSLGLAVRAHAAVLDRSDSIRFTHDPLGAGLLLAWLGSFLPVWLPRFAPGQWPAEWADRVAAGFPGWQPVAMQALGWLIAGALLRSLTRPALVWPVMAALALGALTIRFTWFAHFAGNAELIGGALALIAWPVAARLSTGALVRLLAASLLGGLIYRGLAPFTFGPWRHDFHWVPFTDLVSHLGSTGFNLPLLSGKAFTYGTLVWLVVAAGGRALRSGCLVAAILFAIELAQLGSPPGEHVATMTDPAIALCAGFVLMLLGPGTVAERRGPDSAVPA